MQPGQWPQNAASIGAGRPPGTCGRSEGGSSVTIERPEGEGMMSGVRGRVGGSGLREAVSLPVLFPGARLYEGLR